MVANWFSDNLTRWQLNSRRWDPLHLLGTPLRRRRFAAERRRLLQPPVDTGNVEVLHNPAYQASIAQAKFHTLLDHPRLANLWNYAQLVGPGAFLEVGSLRGGSALHLCHAIAAGATPRPFHCFDPFETGGFTALTPDDELFRLDDFLDTSYARVRQLLAPFPFAHVHRGFFPAAAENLNLGPIALCHLDVDVYLATCESLAWLRTRLAPRSAILIDDVNRRCRGVDRALAEFTAAFPEFLLLPLFPSQGLLLNRNLW
jgi:hypothetical protein